MVNDSGIHGDFPSFDQTDSEDPPQHDSDVSLCCFGFSLLLSIIVISQLIREKVVPFLAVELL